MLFKKHELARFSSTELTKLKELLPDLTLDPVTGEAHSSLADKARPDLAASDAMAKLRAIAIKQSPPVSLDQIASILRKHQAAIEATPLLQAKRKAEKVRELAELAKHVPWAACAIARD